MQASVDGRSYPCLFSRREREDQQIFCLIALFFFYQAGSRTSWILKGPVLYWTFKEVPEARVVIWAGAVAQGLLTAVRGYTTELFQSKSTKILNMNCAWDLVI